jgi:hypothetical protein
VSFQRDGKGLLEDIVVRSFSFGFCCSATARGTLRVLRLEVSEAGAVLILLSGGKFLFLLLFDL